MGLPFWDIENSDPFRKGRKGKAGGVREPITGGAPGYDSQDPLDIYPANQWDLCVLDGKVLPGVARCKAKPERKVDPKKKAGTDGANPTVHGYDPKPVEIQLTIWLPQQLRILVSLMDTYWPPLGKLFKKKDGKIHGKVEPLKVQHPELDFLRISQVLIVGVSSPQPGKVVGSKEITFYCLEYNKEIPKSVTTTPKAAKKPNLHPLRSNLASYQPPANAEQDANYSPANATQSLPSTNTSFTDPSVGP